MPTAELLKGDEEEGRGDDCSMQQAIKAKAASLSRAKHAIFSQKFVGFVADCSDSAAAAPRREADDVEVRRHRLPLAVSRRRRFILIIQSPEYIIIIVKIVSTRVKAL